MESSQGLSVIQTFIANVLFVRLHIVRDEPEAKTRRENHQRKWRLLRRIPTASTDQQRQRIHAYLCAVILAIELTVERLVYPLPVSAAMAFSGRPLSSTIRRTASLMLMEPLKFFIGESHVARA